MAGLITQEYTLTTVQDHWSELVVFDAKAKRQTALKSNDEVLGSIDFGKPHANEILRVLGELKTIAREAEAVSIPADQNHPTIHIYPSGLGDKNLSQQILSFEPWVAAINYARGAVIALNYSAISVDEKIRLQNLTYVMLQKHQGVLTGDDRVAAAKASVKFESYVCEVIQLSRHEMNLARECALMLDEPATVITVSKDKNSAKAPIQIEVSETMRLNASEMEVEFRDDFQNKAWFKAANKGVRHDWFKSFVQANHRTIVERGNPATPASRWRSAPANFKKETHIIAKVLSDGQLKKEFSAVEYGAGILTPFDIDDRAARIAAIKEALFTIFKKDINARINDYLDHFEKLYPEGGEIDFPLLYNTLLSPIRGLDFAADMAHQLSGKYFGYKDNNGRFLAEIQEAMGSITEDELQTQVLPKATLEKGGKKFTIKPRLLHVNTAVNENSVISLTQDSDVEDTNVLISSAADEIDHFANLLTDETEKSTLKAFAAYLKSPNVSLTGKWGFSDRKPIEFLLGFDEKSLAAIQQKLLNNNCSDILPEAAQVELAHKISAARQLRHMNHESFGGWLRRKASNLPYVGWALSIPLSILKLPVNILTSPIHLIRYLTGRNQGIDRPILLERVMGRKGTKVSGCKSDRDRAGVILSGTHAAQLDLHEQKQKDTPLVVPTEHKLLNGIRAQLQGGAHMIRRMSSTHVGVVKLTDVAKGIKGWWMKKSDRLFQNMYNKEDAAVAKLLKNLTKKTQKDFPKGEPEDLISRATDVSSTADASFTGEGRLERKLGLTQASDGHATAPPAGDEGGVTNTARKRVSDTATTPTAGDENNASELDVTPPREPHP